MKAKEDELMHSQYSECRVAMPAHLSRYKNDETEGFFLVISIESEYFEREERSLTEPS